MNVATSDENLDGLLTIQGKLGDGQLNIAASEQNLDGLLTIQTTLVAQTRNLADAIQTLEVLSGFREELNAQIQALAGVRHDLVELSLMETSLAKVARIMKPLVELGNIRRLSDEELRHAARSILDGRTATRVTKNSSDNRPTAISGISAETSADEYGDVPMPTNE